MEHTGHRERLRKRFDESGLTGFSDHEVLELMLTYAIPRVDVNPLAHRLMNRFGSFSAVLEASADELKQVEGMGERSAALLCMLLPLLKRYEKDKLQGKRKLKTFTELAGYCSTLFIGSHEEKFFLLCFDAKLQLTREILLSSGITQEVRVQPGQVAREAMRAGAVSVVVAHNHPSGDPAPSNADRELTLGIRDALATVEIKLMDHVVVGIQQAYSFHRDDLLPLYTEETEYMAAEDMALVNRKNAGLKICREDEDYLCY